MLGYFYIVCVKQLLPMYQETLNKNLRLGQTLPLPQQETLLDH